MAQLLFNIPPALRACVRSGLSVRYPAAGRRRFCGGPHHLPRRIPSRATSANWWNIPRPCRCASLRGAGQPGVGACANGCAHGGHTIAELRQRPDGRCGWWPSTAAFRTSPTVLSPARRHPHRAGRRGVCAGAQEHIAHVLSALHRRDASNAPPVRRIMIAGGDRVACAWHSSWARRKGAFTSRSSNQTPALRGVGSACRLRCWCCRARPPTKTCSMTRAWKRWTCSWR